MVSNLKEHNARVNDVKCLGDFFSNRWELGIVEGCKNDDWECFCFGYPPEV